VELIHAGTTFALVAPLPSAAPPVIKAGDEDEDEIVLNSDEDDLD
jgi:hypothetical protein